MDSVCDKGSGKTCSHYFCFQNIHNKDARGASFSQSVTAGSMQRSEARSSKITVYDTILSYRKEGEKREGEGRPRLLWCTTIR